MGREESSCVFSECGRILKGGDSVRAECTETYGNCVQMSEGIRISVSSLDLLNYGLGLKGILKLHNYTIIMHPSGIG